MSRWEAKECGTGEVLQSSLPKREPMPDESPLDAQGLFLRGAVLARYAYDPPAPGSSPAGGEQLGQSPTAIYVDVLVYSNIANYRGQVLRALCPQELGASIHDGTMKAPRPARLRLTGLPVGQGISPNPAELDSSHVIVGFLDGDRSLPFIFATLPHPNLDLGHSALEDAGGRLRLLSADDDSGLSKWHGVVHGVASDGTFILDLTNAHDGVLGPPLPPATPGPFPTGYERPGTKRPDAERVDPTTGAAKHGNMVVKLPRDSSLTFEWEALPGAPAHSLTLSDHGGKLVANFDHLELGGASASALLGEVLRDYVNNNLKVATAFGPSGPPSAVPDPLAKFPDGLAGRANALSAIVKLR